MLVSKLDADFVVALLGGQIFDGTAAVAVIFAGHLCLGGTFDSQAESALTSTSCLHGEGCGYVGNAALQT